MISIKNLLKNNSCIVLFLTQYRIQGDIFMLSTGEKPGKGVYTCTKCGQKVILDDNSDTLPPCPKCEATNYTP
ncbi:hypothetical protein [Shewanella sp. MEBiC00475]|uniref:zinc ribbon-containing protein n=1 Tax=Shewanella sp. MEBiC00475 TaxID=2575361 RepID=UPI0034A0BE53